MTMTMLEEGTLDWLDFAITCHDEDGCNQPADWWLVCLNEACRLHTPRCDAHKRATVGYACRVELDPFTEVFCRECGRTVPSRLWRDLYTFVPIGSA